MIRPMIAFLAGAATTAAAVFLAGGQARAGLLIGAIMILLAAFMFPRITARLLIATADAGEKFRESFSKLQLTSTKVDAAQLNHIQRDVVAALRNQGMPAKRAMTAVVAAGEASDFETLFRKVVSA
jgi:hypothetical protein